jgi:long-chain acyl-CoA synthetase
VNGPANPPAPNALADRSVTAAAGGNAYVDPAGIVLAAHGSKPAITWRGRAMSYAELEQWVAGLATQLRDYFEAGELVGLWLPNCPEMLQMCLASWRNRMVAMPLNAETSRPELISICRQAGLHTLVTNTALAATLAAADLQATGLQRLLVCDAPGGALRPNSAVHTLVHGNKPLLPAAEAALVLHTSGTSGAPKAVVLSPTALGHIIGGRIASARIEAQSVALVASCLSHSVGLYQSLAYLQQGASFELLESYELEQLVETLHRLQPSHLIMVVSAFQKLLLHPGVSAQSFSRLRFASVGADRVPAELQQRFQGLTGQVLAVSYGMTELSWILLNNLQDPACSTALGRPTPGVEVELLDASGQPVADGELGEIVARSPKLMSGYLTRDGISRSELQSGWIHSGDLARRDANGVYWFAGRIKDLIVVSSGDVVSPAEIEQATLLLDSVKDCVAVGVEVTEADTGSRVMEPWLVITSSTPGLEAAEVQQWLSLQLSPHKVPRRIVFRQDLPNSITGKVSRQQLAEFLQALPA